jgi:hypothetical protein
VVNLVHKGSGGELGRVRVDLPDGEDHSLLIAMAIFDYLGEVGGLFAVGDSLTIEEQP